VAPGALAQLALVVDDDDGTVARHLLDLATAEDYSLAQAGRRGLRMLSDIGRSVDVDALIELFAKDPRADEPYPQWVADNLTTDARIQAVRQAAFSGRHLRALVALVDVDAPEVNDLGALDVHSWCLDRELTSDPRRPIVCIDAERLIIGQRVDRAPDFRIQIGKPTAERSV